MNEEITYLVTSYRCGRYFDDVMASLEAQTSRSWRALVCDDASPDDSWATLKSRVAASRARANVGLVRNERNLGYVPTLRRLIAESQTDVVGILDGDDALTPRATDAILSAYAREPRAGFVYSRMERRDATMGKVLGQHGEAIPPAQTMLQSNRIPVMHLRTFRRRLYAETPGLDEAMIYADDQDLMFKLEERCRPVFVAEVLYLQRVRSGSQTHPSSESAAIGRRNLIKARAAGMRRRGIRGWRYRFAILLDWLKYSPDRLNRWVWPLKIPLDACDRQFRIRARGELRRGTWLDDAREGA
jgi:glycosyltransferase involved in cell wall biosynthesis